MRTLIANSHLDGSVLEGVVERFGCWSDNKKALLTIEERILQSGFGCASHDVPLRARAESLTRLRL